jgi:hypothetical protein
MHNLKVGKMCSFIHRQEITVNKHAKSNFTDTLLQSTCLISEAYAASHKWKYEAMTAHSCKCQLSSEYWRLFPQA